MKQKGQKVNFDLSTMSLKELVKTYNSISEFIKFLDGNKIIREEKGKENDG